MVKLMYKNLVVLGLIPSELEHLKQGQPLNISMKENGSNQVIVIIPGDNHEQLHAAAKSAAEILEKASNAAKGKIIVPEHLKGKPH